jgi:predicted Fe-Mo cluster-binding NifX family protein
MKIAPKITYALLFLLLSIFPLGNLFAADKLAVAAEGSEANASISTRAARAPFYLIFEQNGRMIMSLQNTAAEEGSGASSKAVKLLEKHGVGTLIAGDFGGKILDAMKEREIKHVIATGIVADTIRKLKK